MAEFLTDSGFALVALDLRGHGRSQGQRGFFSSYKTLLGDITLFIKEVKKHFKKTPIFLYGQSLGGNIAINYTLRYEPRFKGTIASAPMLRTAFKQPAWKISLGKMMYKLWPTLSLSSGVDLYGLSRDTNVVHSRLNDTLYHNRVTPRFLSAFKAGEWALRNTERLDIPLMLMHGDADRITSFETSCDFAKSAGSLCKLKVWKGYYHALHEEVGKEAVFAYVVKWMNKKLKK
jgi:alpha-beta hydrolase superfamily lysophospholipase